MVQDYTKQNQTDTAVQDNSGIRTHFEKVYGYMATGLGLTGVISYALSKSEAFLSLIVQNQMLFMLFSFAPLIYVMVYQSRINRMSRNSAMIGFYIYAALMGASLTPIFWVYTQAMIFQVFLITAGAFAGTSLFGMVTKRDLSGIGGYLVMGLWGLIIASVANMFIGSEGLSFAVSLIGVAVSIGLIAYSTQMIKSLYYNIGSDDKMAILGALHLYISFINLFMFLLRLFSARD